MPQPFNFELIEHLPLEWIRFDIEWGDRGVSIWARSLECLAKCVTVIRLETGIGPIGIESGPEALEQRGRSPLRETDVPLQPIVQGRMTEIRRANICS